MLFVSLISVHTIQKAISTIAGHYGFVIIIISYMHLSKYSTLKHLLRNALVNQKHDHNAFHAQLCNNYGFP